MILVSALILLLAAQTTATGEWAVTLDAVMGERRFTMLLTQKGERLTGDILNETGQFELAGTVKGDNVVIEWTYPEGGRLIKLTFTGKLAGNAMTGTTKAGDLGEAVMYAQRTGG